MQDRSSLLLRGATVWTMDPAGTHYAHGDLLIQAGRIAAVGDHGTITPAGEHEEIWLSGLVLLPGLINCHTHLSLTDLKGLGNNLPLFPWLRRMGTRIGSMENSEILEATGRGMRQLLRSGVTCLCDCGPNGPGQVASTGRQVGVRTLSGLMMRSDWFGRPVACDVHDAQEQTRALIASWAGPSGLARFFLGAHALYTVSDDLLQATKRAASDLGLDFNLHLAENAEETAAIEARSGLSPVALADKLGLLDEHTIANHCVQVSERDLDILARSGARVAHCPTSNAKLASGIAPVPDMRRRGIPVGLGTDSAASNDDLHMLAEMKMAVLLQRAASLDPASLTAADALRMCTLDAATVLGMDAIIGSLEPGKEADLIAIRGPLDASNPPAAQLEELVFAPLSSEVVFLMVAGRIHLNETDPPHRIDL